MIMGTELDIHNRSRLLLGDENMERLKNAKVIVFGVGGVGSWCVESLVRTGVTNITIVDSDRVSDSNINRQLMATTETVGRVKVEALKEYLLRINPDANIDAREEVFTAETVDRVDLDRYDYTLDAIDSLKDKMLLIEMATATQAKFYSSLGAALKLDPTRIRVAEFWKVTGCPLARALRQRFKKQKRYPKRKFLCVYSDELLANKGEAPTERTGRDLYKASINGSLQHITAIFGLTLAGLLIQDLTTR